MLEMLSETLFDAALSVFFVVSLFVFFAFILAKISTKSDSSHSEMFPGQRLRSFKNDRFKSFFLP